MSTVGLCGTDDSLADEFFGGLQGRVIGIGILFEQNIFTTDP